MSSRGAHDRTLRALGEAIVGGRYAAGASIPPEPALCEDFGVSRTVVREVVKALVAKGLVTTGPKVGTRVQPAERWNWFDADVVGWQVRCGVTSELLRDLQELRRVVEPEAARLAALRATAADRAALGEAYEGMELAVSGQGDYVGQDLRFHQALLDASHNRMLVQMGKAIGALLRTSFEVSAEDPRAVADSLPMHRAVLLAVVAGSPTRAERASRRQIDGATAAVEGVLQARRPSGRRAAPAPKVPRR